jgi:arylsulfatase A-like enzyme
MGNASDLAEWDDLGTPSTWDDVNLVNQLATREEVLDVARDADYQLGRLLDFLEERGRLDGSYVVVTADHGQVTHPPRGIVVERVLRRAGIAPTEVAIQAGSSQIIIYDLDEENARLVETALEPLGIVYNRAEMETGFDETSGTAFAEPGELYSEYWVGRDDTDGIHYRWPSLYVFHDGSGQYVIDRQFWASPREPLLQLLPPKTWFVGGHGGPGTQHVPIILAGPGIESSVVRYELVRLHQIAPTLYQLLGIEPPASVDGLPLP